MKRKIVLPLVFSGALVSGSALGDSSFKERVERFVGGLENLTHNTVCVEGSLDYNLDSCESLLNDRKIAYFGLDGNGFPGYLVKMPCGEGRIVSFDGEELEVDEFDLRLDGILSSYNLGNDSFSFDDDYTAMDELTQEKNAKKYITQVLDLTNN